MDSYLEIARTVLRSSRQPLSARQILKTALQLQLVPRDLYGRTQHKTLQARLATDILKHRSRSEFYRTGPGKFFLKAFQADCTIPYRYRQEYQAPVRAAQLGRFDVVAFPRRVILDLAAKGAAPFSIDTLYKQPWRFAKLYSLRRDRKLVPFKLLLLLFADGRVLMDHRSLPAIDGDLSRRSSIGIGGYVKRGDLSLFSSDDFGLMDAAVRTLLEQFELPNHVRPLLEEAGRWSPPLAIIDNGDRAGPDLAVYLSFRCAGISEITEAVGHRLSSEWLSMPIRLNDLNRFDKWSCRLAQDSQLQASLCV